MKYIFIFYFLFFILSISFISAEYSDCSIYGTCKPSGNIINNGNTTINNINNTYINGSSFNITYDYTSTHCINATLVNDAFKTWYVGNHSPDDANRIIIDSISSDGYKSYYGTSEIAWLPTSNRWAISSGDFEIPSTLYSTSVDGLGITSSTDPNIYWVYDGLNNQWLTTKKIRANQVDSAGSVNANTRSSFYGGLDTFNGGINTNGYNIDTANITANNICYSNGTGCQPSGNTITSVKNLSEYIQGNTTIIPGTFTYNITDRSLISLWALNNGTGENATYFKDETGRYNSTCVSSNCPKSNITNAIIGNSSTLNGTNYIISPNLDIVTNITISLWEKCDSSNTDYMMIGSKGTLNGGWVIQLQNGAGVIRNLTWITNNVANSIAPISCDTWHHIAITQSATNSLLYVDGSLIVNNTAQNAIPSNANNIEWGRRSDGYYFKGNLDEIRIYNRTLGITEIQSLYALGVYSNYTSGGSTTIINNTLDLSGMDIKANNFIGNLSWNNIFNFPWNNFVLNNQTNVFQTYDFKANVTVPGITVTGGTKTNDSQYTYHAFLTNGTFVTNGNLNVDVLVVGGGGASGLSYGGGGGAGGLVYQSGKAITSGSYNVVIGNGGVGNQVNGANSSFDGIIGIGGGGGGYSNNVLAKNGGSGGGGGGFGQITGGSSIQGNYTGTGYGHSGGNGVTGQKLAGGGGGAGTAGSTAVSSGGNGGAGMNFSSIFGTTYGQAGWFAGGGGGGADAGASGGTGGRGGGGNGTGGSFPTVGNGLDGMANTGGGGGGPNQAGAAGSGGSGIVIIRYLTSDLGGSKQPVNVMNVTDGINVGERGIISIGDSLGRVLFYGLNITFMNGININGNIAQSNGNSTLTTYYGEMNNFSINGYTATPGAANVYYNITNLKQDFMNGFRVIETGTTGTKLQAVNPGLYDVYGKVTWAIENGGTYGFAIVNNSANPEATGDCYSQADGVPSSGKESMSVGCYYRLNAGDNLTAVYDSQVGTKTLTIYKVEVKSRWISN